MFVFHRPGLAVRSRVRRHQPEEALPFPGRRGESSLRPMAREMDFTRRFPHPEIGAGFHRMTSTGKTGDEGLQRTSLRCSWRTVFAWK